MTEKLTELLEQSAAHHRHLCPRQVLGVRMGLLAGQLLGIPVPQAKKQLLTIVETDGCFADGVAVATNCWVGRRTLRVEDYGKVAATFVNTKTETAVRLYPNHDSRQLAAEYAPEACNRWQSYLLGYQRLPATLLFGVQSVKTAVPVARIISRAGKRVHCTVCGEEIINEREVRREELLLCRSCAGESYYSVADSASVFCWEAILIPSSTNHPERSKDSVI